MVNVVIRVDSSSQIGSGHLMRCLTLAGRLLDSGADVHFICRDIDGNLSHLVSEQGYDLLMLPRAERDDMLTGYAAWLTVPQERDAADTIEAMNARGLGHVDILVVDSYAIGITWEKKLRPMANKIFVIDDLVNRKHDCDVLLDANFYSDGGANRYDGLVSNQCRRLVGPQYVLLRDEFYVAREKQPVRDGNIHRILVFYGGSDMTDETTKAINAIIKLKRNFCQELANNSCLDENFTADIIVGGSNKNSDKIKDLCKSYDFLTYHFQISNMARMMAEADIMVGAGGTTTWERCCMGLPAIVTAVADNQETDMDEYVRAGFIKYIGKSADVTSDTIIDALRNMTAECLMSMSNKGRSMMSGNVRDLNVLEI